MFEMQMEDEQQHEDGMAISAGTMCRFCLSVMHVAATVDDCPRENRPTCDDCLYYLDTNTHDDGCPTGERVRLLAVATDAFYAEQEGKPDFTCTNCNGEFFIPHEGYFLDIHDEMVGRCIDCHIKNFKPCSDELCCA